MSRPGIEEYTIGMLKSREDAGRKIARSLTKYHSKDAIVFAIPRGGVIVGRSVADELGVPLDIVVTRKLVVSGNPSNAFGAIDEAGNTLLDEALVKTLPLADVEAEIERQKAEVSRRAKLYRSGKQPISARDSVAIIVDDGITTGYNIRPAVSFIKSQYPKKIVVAIPVAPRESLETVRSMVDEIVTLLPPETFGKSVDEHYKEFAQPDDMEVIDAFLHSKIREPQKPFHADITLVDDKKFFSSSE